MPKVVKADSKIWLYFIPNRDICYSNLKVLRDASHKVIMDANLGSIATGCCVYNT